MIDMGAAAELFAVLVTLVPDLDDADFIAVLFGEQRDCASATASRYEDCWACTGASFNIAALIERSMASSCSCVRAVGCVKSKRSRSGRHDRTGLLHVFAKDRSQLVIEQVRRRVIPPNVHAAGLIYHR